MAGALDAVDLLVPDELEQVVGVDEEAREDVQAGVLGARLFELLHVSTTASLRRHRGRQRCFGKGKSASCLFLPRRLLLLLLLLLRLRLLLLLLSRR